MDQDSAQRQDVRLEDDLLDEAGVASHRGRGSENSFSEDIEGDQPAIEQQPEGQGLALLGPACLEYLPEDKGKDR